MLKREVRGSGPATEFIRGFLKLYAPLSRSQAEVEVARGTLGGLATSSGGDEEKPPVCEEQLVALTLSTNMRSQRVLEKVGFNRFSTFTEPDPHDTSGKAVIENVDFRYFPGRATRSSV